MKEKTGGTPCSKKDGARIPLMNICYGLARGIGRLAGGTSRLFGSRAQSKPVWPYPSDIERLRIRRIVVQQLSRLQGDEGMITREEFEERLQRLVASILALQQKIDELSVHGPVSEAVLSQAIASVSAAESLGEEEKSVLASIFRHNIAIQKPDLLDSFVSETAAEKKRWKKKK